MSIERINEKKYLGKNCFQKPHSAILTLASGVNEKKLGVKIDSSSITLVYFILPVKNRGEKYFKISSA
ncbi:hypothetical protein [Dethiobacter alkaliphilus]|uniref:hypothetical protein n=1 Tax=Dethiobacter alkaliphilus TaxID=427926 RepID=UPI0022266C32|nr:hypothetical protein [Dethiobacter alkaliphilus]MCW3491519.1 hypothetical protein [Dethiobacter alkaliphilus]